MTIEDLSARLETVERQNRILRAAGAAIVLLLAAGGLVGFRDTVLEDVQANKIEIVDQGRHPRIVLSTNEKGEPWITLTTKDGDNILSLYADSDGMPHVNLWDRINGASAMLIVTKDAQPKLSLNGRKGTGTSASIGLGDYGPSVDIRAGKGKGEATLGCLGGDPALLIWDAAGNMRSVVGPAKLKTAQPKVFETTEPSSLVLLDKDGKVIERLPK